MIRVLFIAMCALAAAGVAIDVVAGLRYEYLELTAETVGDLVHAKRERLVVMLSSSTIAIAAGACACWMNRRWPDRARF